ncbi:MAG TPA: SMP-30/gluconolactonase/LRE family protein [Alphaproteobacteria bacterium]|nr:SMP-30/gluconolactonase/LRE family protein [Alphaproteobacteria bacterium]
MAEILSGPLEMAASGFAYAEDPRWRNGRLYFSDMYGGKMHSVDRSGAVETVLELGEGTPSGLGFMPNGDLLAVLMFERTLLRLNKSGIAEHADLTSPASHSINDMVADRAARAASALEADRALAPKIRSSRILRFSVDFEGTGLP